MTYTVDVIITPNGHNPEPGLTWSTRVGRADAADAFEAKSYALAFCPVPFAGRDVTVRVDGREIRGRF